VIKLQKASSSLCVTIQSTKTVPVVSIWCNYQFYIKGL
jgi:hypothetical protein